MDTDKTIDIDTIVPINKHTRSSSERESFGNVACIKTSVNKQHIYRVMYMYRHTTGR